ncbi:predicted protein [Nematostella vectensis]|uniref:Uncharacterized protein n=1 Tax=Nematostella vectensis TaxID=45351 RepID=A7SSA9_NEMVE|nr:predicted protein [Nematostella vectensis]|eukprot:XP_001625525.1 predicted protein [Nematostella vectensis]
MSETDELASKLARRTAINEGEEKPRFKIQVFNPYTEFKEFSRKQIKEFEKMFKNYDTTIKVYLVLMNYRQAEKKHGCVHRTIGIREINTRSQLTYHVFFFQFLLIFRKSAAGELVEGSGLAELARLAEIDVDEVGVGGAATFFEAKIKQAQASSQYELEILQEQEERKKEAELAKQRKEQFKAKKAAFAAS